MLWKAISIFVLEFLSVATELNLPPQCCVEDLCYLNPDLDKVTWTEAQERCKFLKSTLPIVDSADHNRNFVAALGFFQLIGDSVWIGAKAFENSSSNWTWLDGSKYFGADVESRGQYENSYAYLTKRQNKVIAYASSPITSYSYICQYQSPSADCKNGTGETTFNKENRCYVKHDEQLPWFSARNKCLSRNGDLASFNNISLLDDVIDTKAYWVGLRHSQWKWLDEVNNQSSDVNFTLWSIDQPDDKTPTCISTNTDPNFPNWRDWGCARSLQFICQVESLMNTPAPRCTAPSTTSTTTTFSLSPTNRNPSESLSSSTTKHNKNNTDSISPMAENQNNDTGSVNVALAVGLGVGIGVPVLILIVVVVIVLIVRRKRQSGTTSGNSQTRKTFVFGNSHRNPEMDQTEMSETQNGGTRMDDSAAQYATITEATGPKLNPPSTQGTVYEGLSFDQAGSS